MPQTITIPLPDPGKLGLTKIIATEAGEDSRGDLVLLSDGVNTASLDRNNVAAYCDDPLPEGKMTPAIEGRNLVITFG